MFSSEEKKKGENALYSTKVFGSSIILKMSLDMWACTFLLHMYFTCIFH